MVALAAMLGASSGCGYALVGRGGTLPATIRSIGVPLFENRSVIGEIDQALTKAVVAEFQGRGKYRIETQASGVDAVLTGIITAVTLTPIAFTPQNQVSRNLVIVTASLEFKEVATNKVIWSNPSFQVRDEYDVTTGTTANDAAAFFTQDANAFERMAKSFSRSVVAAIFEGV